MGAFLEARAGEDALLENLKVQVEELREAVERGGVLPRFVCTRLRRADRPPRVHVVADETRAHCGWAWAASAWAKRPGPARSESDWRPVCRRVELKHGGNLPSCSA